MEVISYKCGARNIISLPWFSHECMFGLSEIDTVLEIAQLINYIFALALQSKNESGRFDKYRIKDIEPNLICSSDCPHSFKNTSFKSGGYV